MLSVDADVSSQGLQLFRSQFALPDYDDSPAEVRELFVGSLVASDICIELSLPEIWIRGWRSGVAAPIMSMPKAAMDEHDSTILRQNDIWFSRQVFRGDAISQAMRMQIFSDNQFGLRVTPPNAGHHPATSCAIDDVCHQAARRTPAARMNIG